MMDGGYLGDINDRFNRLENRLARNWKWGGAGELGGWMGDI